MEEKTQQMWDTILKLVADAKETETKEFGKIFDVIRTNLIFDDPGLISTEYYGNNSDEIEREECLNFWLLNQLIWNSIQIDNQKANNHINYQKDILIGAFVKKPSLYYKIMKEYIQLIVLLSNSETTINNALPIKIELFHSKNVTYMTEILPNSRFTIIEINNIKQQEQLLENTIKILTHILPNSINIYSELIEECSLKILNAINSSSVPIKIVCFDYMLKALHADYNLYSNYLPFIFKAYHKILLNLQLWIEIGNIDNLQMENLKILFTSFLKRILSYYEENLIYENIECEITEYKEINKTIFENLFNILNAIATIRIQNFKWKNLIEDITAVLLWLSKKIIIDNEYLETIKKNNLLKSTPKLIQIFEYTIITQIQRNLTEDLIENLSEIWKSIYNDFFNETTKKLINLNEENFIEYLTILTEIFRLVNNIEFTLKVLHQRQQQRILDSDCIFCNDAICSFSEHKMEKDFLRNNDLEKIIKNIFVAMKQEKKLDKIIFIKFTKLINLLIQNLFFQYFNEDLQKSIAEIYLQYFEKVVNINDNFPFQNVQSEKLIYKICIEFFVNINVPKNNYLSKNLEQILQRIYARQDLQLLQREFFPKLIELLLGNLIQIEFLETYILKPLLTSDINTVLSNELISNFFQNLICFIYGNIEIYRMKNCESNKTIIIFCKDCETNFNLNCKNIINNAIKEEINKPIAKSILMKSEIPKLLLSIEKKKSKFLVKMLSHIDYIQNDLILKNWKIFAPEIIQLLLGKYPASIYEPILDEFVRELQSDAFEICRNGDINEQKNLLELINKFAVNKLPEKYLLLFFKLTILFIIPVESKIQNESAALAQSMCSKNKIRTKQLLNWYLKDILQLVIKLYVSTYLINGCGLQSSLQLVSIMFGFEDLREFVFSHYKQIVAILLHYVVKIQECEQILQELANYTKFSLANLLKKSFVTFYVLYIIDDQLETSDECLEYLEEKTGQKIYILMNSDINKVVARMLFYYHKNPKIVMDTFRCSLFQKSVRTGNEGSSSRVVTITKTKDLVKFIAERFLGVVTYFEYYLMNSEFEKHLKYEILLSLGEIIRFLGSIHITPFHFKILALLSTVITINNEYLKTICIDVWNIFIHNVDVQVLGPSLSRIVATLEPELENHKDKINEMYYFLIISNVNLLSVHIPELYFIEKYDHCLSEIKNAVKEIISKNEIEIVRKLQSCYKGNIRLKDEEFLEKISFFLKQISHESITVRINGITYLRDLFATNRDLVNRVVLGQNYVNPLIELVLVNLIIGCKDSDINLKLASGKCLGELGAIEPGLLRSNYSKQEKPFPLNIHSDDFAIIALIELCKAYQFQKDTQYVDNFSLGIQEILRTKGVCPEKNSKMNIWNAIPTRMRQIMEPFLTSCYTGLQKSDKKNQSGQPTYGSDKSKTFIDWAFFWSASMISAINDDDTKHLLNSLLPSLRRDNKILDLILPYIVLHSLMDDEGVKSSKKIYEELNAVFKSIKSTSYNFSEVKKNVVELSFQSSASDLHILKQEDGNDISLNKKCSKLSLEVLDFIERWIREFQENGSQVTDKKYLTVKRFYDSFEKLEIANVNFLCEEYARALKIFENFLFENQINGCSLQEHLSLLIKIYAELMDLDALEGAIYIKQSHSSLKEQILVNTMTDRVQDTMACYEQLMMEKSTELTELTPLDWHGIVQCYLRLDTPETALLISQGIMNRLGVTLQNETLKEIQAEPLWRLSRFDELEELLNNPVLNNSNNWSIKCGQALLLFRNNSEDFDKKINDIRFEILKMFKFSGTDFDSYQKWYSQITKLHLVNDIEKVRNIVKIVSRQSCDVDEALNILKEFFEDWNDRLEYLQPTIKTKEPFICLRRILLSETKKLITSHVHPKVLRGIDEEIGKLWVKSIKLNRKAGCLQQANLNILNAERFKPENLFIEKAKCLWSKGDQTQCFKVLEDKITEFCKLGTIEELPKDKRLLYAEAKFLQAFYNSKSMNINSELNIQHFQDSIKANIDSEKCYIHLAEYYDKIGLCAASSDLDKANLFVMFNYGRSMQHGCEYMYQAMPRMLSIWFESNESKVPAVVLDKMNNIMSECASSLPLFLFFTAFSQLISRVCHPSETVWKILKTIVIRLILCYPQHSLWMILPIFKSSLPSRVKRCAEIFHDTNLKNMRNLIRDFNSLSDKLIELTNMDITSSPTPPVSQLISQLPKLLHKPDFSLIMMPFERFMRITLPPLGNGISPNNHNPFPHNLVYIKTIREEITILSSMQKPKKIILVGTDGNEYTFMLKPRDDLRKDFRLMEFNIVVKQYLYQDPQARQRRLGIKTYAVQPLNEECGIVEWLTDLITYRNICLNILKKRNLSMTNKELTLLTRDNRDPERLKAIFLNKILPNYPPVFHEWFLKQFPNPHNWYQARTTYIRTTAVMSIVGYILGLGDRHGENVLLDGIAGDICHVDFNCLFNRGEHFAIPEVVPFRLTHSMVQAMGPLGIEGPFRKCCEITMRILYLQTPILMAVLKPFIYDPMVSWNKNNPKNLERTDAEAITNVQRIEARLKGFVSRLRSADKKNMPLSPEGVVNYVIKEATSINNLSVMYIGWGPFY